jgi:hypothetical protein
MAMKGDDRTNLYKSIHNPELYARIMNNDFKYDNRFKHMPNQKFHKLLSFIKSGIRIYGYILFPFSMTWAMLVLILAEIIGILEEAV